MMHSYLRTATASYWDGTGREEPRGLFFMAENNVTVKCPKCNSFLLRTIACESTEINCIDGGCKATLIVTVKDGRISINEIERPKYKGFAQRT